MRRCIVLIALVGLAVSTLSVAQTLPGSIPQKSKKITISGKVINDGTGILEAEHRTWFIVNAEALRSHAGKTVTVRGLLDLATGRIQVWSFKPASMEVTAAARLGDSAFRR